MFRSILKAAACGCAFLMFAVAPARAAFNSGLIDVDFVLGLGAPQTGAALIGSAGDKWNEVQAPPSVALVDSTGAATGVTLLNTGTSGIALGGAPFAATPFDGLMSNGLVSPANKTFTLTGLTANQSYELYFYSQSNPQTPGSTTYVINGDSRTVNFDGTTGTFIEGTTFAHFAGETADGTGTLVVNVSGSGIVGGIVGGFQLQAIPPNGGGGSGVPLPAGAWAGMIGLIACGVIAAAQGRKARLA